MRKKYLYFEEKDFDPIELYTKEELYKGYIETHIKDLNYWMELCEEHERRIRELLDELKRMKEGNK